MTDNERARLARKVRQGRPLTDAERGQVAQFLLTDPKQEPNRRLWDGMVSIQPYLDVPRKEVAYAYAVYECGCERKFCWDHVPLKVDEMSIHFGTPPSASSKRME